MKDQLTEDFSPSCYALGIDVGGTNTKMGVFSDEGQLLAKRSFKTLPVKDGGSHHHLEDETAVLLAEAGLVADAIKAVGLAVPGMIAAEESSHLLPNVDMSVQTYRSVLHALFTHAQIELINDANAAALGDAWKGTSSQQKAETVAFITLGTGLGAGIVVGGTAVQGAHGAAGEIGHLCVEPGTGRPCNCGRVGCLEKYVAAGGLVRSATELLQDQHDEAGTSELTEKAPLIEDIYPDAKAVFDGAMNGDAVARAAVDTFARYLGFGLSQFACIVDPALFVIGGGMSGSSEAFIEKLRASYRECALAVCQDTPILISELGNDCGMYGAARHSLLLAK